ncbi:MAG TPA: protein-L-isoaspartate(D-aspartate) O-methyltransferase [Kiritimatiellia bacterium]|nr:protein-L-isoaspartate(D-aspartate) O-methyltransferase [Kiritimatiellia bacterium]
MGRRSTTVFLVAAFAAGQTNLYGDLFAMRRDAMVRETIENRQVTDPATLRAMRAVERHRFVLPELIGNAYDDRPLPIGFGQTISQPYIVALMTELLQVNEDSVVLEIGAGSGYQAAVLAEIVNRVYTIEIVPELADLSANRMKELGYENVVVKEGDGYFGWEEHAPFDGIIVTAAATHIPPPLIEQLKPGGRLVIPVGPPMQVQNLMLIEKTEDGEIRQRSLMPVRFVPFTRR